MRDEPQDVDGAKRIASALLRDCIHVLGLPHPPMEPPAGHGPRLTWAAKWTAWARGRATELRFLNSQRSIQWCEILNMDRDALVDRLRDRDLIYDHRGMVPAEVRSPKVWSRRKRQRQERAS